MNKKLALAGLWFSLISSMIFMFMPKDLKVNLYIVVPYIIICFGWTYLILREKKTAKVAE